MEMVSVNIQLRDTKAVESFKMGHQNALCIFSSDEELEKPTLLLSLIHKSVHSMLF